MLLQLEVIVSSDINRKKPWSRLSFVGEKRESVYLIDRTRISQLYLPSGKTKRVISSLKSYSGSIVCMNISKSGSYVVGLLKNGKIFMWHKDTSKVFNIDCSPEFSPTAGTDASCENIFTNNEGTKILVYVNNATCQLWQQTKMLEGRWYSIVLGSVPLPVASAKETVIDAIFFHNEIQGSNIMCSSVHSQNNNMVINTFNVHSNNLRKDVPFNVEYSSIKYNIADVNNNCKPLKCKGTYVASLSNDGNCLAVVVNQRHPKDATVLFINPSTSTIVNVSLCNIQKENEVPVAFAKTYWISQISWMNDDVFLACITRRGSLLMMSRLGEPILLSTKGLQYDFGPTHLVPLMPLAQYDGAVKSNTLALPSRGGLDVDELSTASSTPSERIWKKKFSIACHPRLPVLLLSNGFSVTALRTTGIVKPFDVATLCLAEATKQLHSISNSHHLEVKLTKGLQFLLPREQTNEAKFKEHPTTVLIKNIKKRLSGNPKSKKPGTTEPLKEVSQNTNNNNVPVASAIKLDDVEESFNFKFEDYNEAFETTSVLKENESSFKGSRLNLDTDSPLGTQEFGSKAGVILNANEGRITFGDLEGASLAPTVQTPHRKILSDGETLLKQLCDCRSQVLTAFSYLLTTTSNNRRKRPGERIKDIATLTSQELAVDEMQSFMLATFRYLCSIIVELQNVADILQFDSQPGGSLRNILCHELVVLGQSVAILSALDRSTMNCGNMIAKAMDIVTGSVLNSSRTAPEGCTTAEDEFENILNCFLLLKKAEKQISTTYRYRKIQLSDPMINQNAVIPTDVHHAGGMVNDAHLQNDKELSVILVSSWKKLHSKLSKILVSKQPNEIHLLLNLVLKQIQRISFPLFPTKVVEDKHPTIDRLGAMAQLLLQYDIRNAISLARSSIHNNLTVNKKWKDNAWLDIELLSSVMILYFCGMPTHIPCQVMLASGCSTVATNLLNTMERCSKTNFYCKPLQKESIVMAIRDPELEHLWSSDQTIAMLLDCGRIQEAVTVAKQFGDWRSSIVLAAASDKNYRVPDNAQKRLPLEINLIAHSLKHCEQSNKSGTPKGQVNVTNLIKSRLYDVFKQVCNFTLGNKLNFNKDFKEQIDVEEINIPVTDVCSLAVMAGVNNASWLFRKLLDSLKFTAQDCSFVVPETFYLPSPPPHLPQIISNSHAENPGKSDVYSNEVQFRCNVSNIVRSLLASFHATKTTAFAASWYLRKLHHGLELSNSSRPNSPFAKTMQNANMLLTQRDLQESSGFELDSFPIEAPNDGSLDEAFSTLSVFRELCSILWLMHVRDNLTLSLRHYQKVRENSVDQNDQGNINQYSDEVQSAFHDCIKWLTLIRPFQQYLFCESEIQDLVLCLSMDIPMDLQLVKILASYFCNPENVNSKVDSRLNQVKKRMRSSGILVPKENSTASGIDIDEEDLEKTLQPFTVFFNEECKRLSSETKIFQLFVTTDQNKLDTIRSMSSTFIPFSSDSETPSEKEYKKLSLLKKTTTEGLLGALNKVYGFENNVMYHEFIENFFSIILNKASEILSGGRGKSKKNVRSGGQLPPLYYPLLLTFRKEIANLEINNVTVAKKFNDTSIVGLKQKRFSKMHTSTPKTISKSPVKDSTIVSIDSARPNKTYISNSSFVGKYKYFSDKNEDGGHSTLKPIPELPVVNLESVPSSIIKKLTRLSPYFEWLEYWNNQTVSRTRIQKGSQRVHLTSEQLMHGFVMAELRFGKWKTNVGRDSKQNTQTFTEVTKPKEVTELKQPLEEVHDVTKENFNSTVEDAKKVDELPKDQEVKKEDVVNDESVKQPPEDSKHEVVQEQEDTGDALVPSAGMIIRKLISDTTEEEEAGVKDEIEEEKQPLVQEIPIDVAPDLSDVASTGLQSDVMADGGGKLRRSHLSAPHSTAKRTDIASVVQSEIQNVLLAQQVSLLSQILLGQTIPGSQNQVNPLINALNSMTGQQQPQQPPPAPAEPEDYSMKYHSPTKPLPAKHYGIPLLRLSGITKSSDPKNVHLTKTPDSKRAWVASEEVKQRSTALGAPPPPSFAKLISIPGAVRKPSPSEYDHHAHTHYVPDPLRPPTSSESKPRSIPVKHNLQEYDAPPQTLNSQNGPQKSTPSNDIQTSSVPQPNPMLQYPYEQRNLNAYEKVQPGPSANNVYKTKFPILNSPLPMLSVNLPPQPPTFNQTHFPSAYNKPQPQPMQYNQPQSREAWASSVHRGTHYGPPVLGHGVMPRLIDPQEVLAYENQKRSQYNQGFQVVKGQRPIIPSVALIQMEAPPFEVSKPSQEKPEKLEKKVEISPPATSSISLHEQSLRDEIDRESGAPESLAFEGRVSQEEMNKRFETAAALHYMAAIRKQLPSENKPRMKSAEQQTESMKVDSEKSFEIPRPLTKPIRNQIPPDIFLNLKFAKENAIPFEKVSDDFKDRFINIGDVDAQAVMHGIQISQMEKDSDESDSAKINDPGFPTSEDEVTANALISKHVKEVTKVKKVRGTMKRQWSNAMLQMDEQLNAIDAMARDMKSDFKGSHNLIRTIDQLTDVMNPAEQTSVPKSPSATSLRSSRSITPPSRKLSLSMVPEESMSLPTRSKSRSPSRSRSLSRSPSRTPPQRKTPPRVASIERSVGSVRSTLSDISNTVSSRMDRTGVKPEAKLRPYISRIDEALKLASWDPSQNDENITRRKSEEEFIVTSPYTGTPLTRSRSASQSTLRSSRDAVYSNASVQHELNDLMFDVEPETPIKSWKNRTADERASIRRWMADKRRERTEAYRQRVQHLRSTEAKPFNPPKTPTRRISKEEKRQMAAEHTEARLAEAMELLDEMKSDKPRLPTQQSVSHYSTKPQPKRVGIGRGVSSKPYGGSIPSKQPYKARIYSNKSTHLPVSKSKRHLITASGIPPERSPRTPPSTKQLVSPRAKHVDAYRKPDLRIPVPDDRLSDISGLSNWSLSDDVKGLLYGTASGRRPRGKGVTFDLGRKGELEEYLPQNSLSLEDFGIGYQSDISQQTESLLADMDWKEVDKLVASVDLKSQNGV